MGRDDAKEYDVAKVRQAFEGFLGRLAVLVAEQVMASEESPGEPENDNGEPSGGVSRSPERSGGAAPSRLGGAPRTPRKPSRRGRGRPTT